MSECLDEARASAFVAGSLVPAQVAVIEAHMAGCGPCRRLISALAASLRPASALPTPTEPIDPPPIAIGDRIGRYRVLAPIGRGGMGRVFAARDPVLGRRVAVKVLHDERWAGGGERLRREAQALARLSDPHVVAVHDVGVHEGRVFLAMELVDGDPLHRWLADRPRTRAEIVAVFLQLGAGLAAAHRAGIVHRDVKPSNVIVGRDPETARVGRVRVLDFGLAHADAAPSHDVDDDSPRTSAGAGTPGYMAPEQRDGSTVDVRADQFAFCVAMLEALHGVRPPAGATVPRPGERGLERVLRRGLAIDPASRWPDMPALLARLAQWGPRADRRPPARWIVGAASVLAAGLLAVGTPTPTSGERADDPAPPLTHADDPTLAAFRAEIEGIVALRDAGRMTAAVELAERLAERGRSITDDRVLAELAFAHGMALTSDDRPAAAAFHEAMQRAQDAGADRLAARAAIELAVALGPEERTPDAEAQWPWLRHAEALVARVGPDDELERALALGRGTLLHAAGDFAGALSAFERAAALAERSWGAQSSALASTLGDVGLVLRELGRLDAAEAMHLRAIEIQERAVGPDHPWTATSLERLGHVLTTAGRFDEAIAVYERTLAIRERAFGAEHRELAASLSNLAGVLLGAGRVDEAIVHLERGLAIEARHGEEGPRLVPLLHTLGNAYRVQRREAAAVAAYARGVAIVERHFGAEHPLGGILLSGRAAAELELGEPAQALRNAETALAIREAALGPEHPSIALEHLTVGLALTDLQRYADAERSLLRALALREGHPGDPALAPEIRFALAQARWHRGDDRAAALALATAATADFAAAGTRSAADVAEMRDWIADPSGASTGALEQTTR